MKQNIINCQQKEIYKNIFEQLEHKLLHEIASFRIGLLFRSIFFVS